MQLTSADQLFNMIDMIVSFLKGFYIVGDFSLFNAILILMWCGVAGSVLMRLSGKQKVDD